jgi:proton-dependent oligopeptide transporter, POT family
MGISEIFFQVTVFEYAYSKAPSSMKSIIMAFGSLAAALGYALGIALSQIAKSTYLIWVFTILASTAFFGAMVFYIYFHRYDRVEGADAKDFESLDEKSGANSG